MSYPRYLLAYEAPGAPPEYYTGWTMSRVDMAKTKHQFAADRSLAKGYGSKGQAAIGRTKLLKARPALVAEQLIIKEDL